MLYDIETFTESSYERFLNIYTGHFCILNFQIKGQKRDICFFIIQRLEIFIFIFPNSTNLNTRTRGMTSPL